jgi:hypothetical protein
MKQKYIPPVLETAPLLTAFSILTASNEDYIINPIDAGLE